MKTIFTLIAAVLLISNLTQAQDTLYIYKSGEIVNKRAVAEIDSIIFYKKAGIPSTTFTVTFVANGGVPSPNVQVVNSGATVTQPANIAQEHYLLIGWSTDVNGTQMYNFSTPVTADMTLYAQWETGPTAFTFRPASEAGDGAAITTGIEITGMIPACLSATHVTVPQKIGADFVTGLAPEAFKNDSFMVSINLPEGLQSIGKNWYSASSTFAGCKNLKGIVIPSTVTQIGVSAFESCTSLTTMDFKPNSSLTDFGYNVFLYCSSLKELQLPSSLTKVFTYLFNGCTGLEKITLPSSITEIQDQAFRYCVSLNTVIVKREASAGITTLATVLVFDGCSSLTTIKVPANSVDDYKNATNWSTFKDLIVSE
jgi:hypothetical protein